MAISRELFAGFTYLSSITSPDLAQKEYDLLLAKLKYIPESFQPWYKKCLDDFSVYDRFPALETFTDAFEQDLIPEYKEAEQLYHRQLAIYESDYLTKDFSSLSVIDRRKRLSELEKILLQTSTDSISVHSVIDKDWTDDFLQKDSVESEGIVFPIKHVNDSLILNPGTHICIFGSPASGKSALALNFAYLNAFTRPFNILYVYLENIEFNYMAELLARHSYSTGMNIQNRALKQKILPTESSAVQKFAELQSRFKSDIKGSISFAPFTAFPTDPSRFGQALGQVCDERNIHLVIFDYAQRASQFNPNPRLDRNSYVDFIVDAVASVALGAYGNKSLVSCMLSQLNREAMNKQVKTDSLSFTSWDGAGSSSLERSAFGIVGIYSSAQSRSECRCSIKVLKARDGEADIEADDQVFYNPAYCAIGDLLSGAKATPQSEIYSTNVMSELFGSGLQL